MSDLEFAVRQLLKQPGFALAVMLTLAVGLGSATVVIAILRYGFWQRQFGGRQVILGCSLTPDGRPHTVIGVMPRGEDRSDGGAQA
jgi:ABC-type spermidine/putrescine transport system permease subunit II